MVTTTTELNPTLSKGTKAHKFKQELPQWHTCILVPQIEYCEGGTFVPSITANKNTYRYNEYDFSVPSDCQLTNCSVSHKELPLSSVLVECATEAADINSTAEVPAGVAASGS
jgi:hypothetical protein